MLMNLNFEKRVLDWLLERGLTMDVIVEAQLHWDGHRIGIPVQLPDGKMFRKWRRDPAIQESPDAPAKYTYDKGATVTLYGADRMARRPDDVVWVVEGEFDALRMISAGFLAVSSTGGASTWRSEWSPAFKGRKVFVWYDADEAGRTGAVKAAESIAQYARSVELVIHDGTLGKDVTDVLNSD